MSQKIATYICSGCGIGDCVKTDGVAAASVEAGVPAATCDFLCSPESAAKLRADLAAQGVERVVVAACSERVNFDVFSPDALGVQAVERVNIREQVAWTKPAGEAETQALAEDYVRMGVARAQQSEMPSRPLEAVERTVLVVGGGITGMTAALQAAAAGSDVVLVEREAELGGQVRRLYKLYPTAHPFDGLRANQIAETIREVSSKPRIKVCTSTKVEGIEGEPGDFRVRLSQDGKCVPVSVGAMVVAAGWQPYDAASLGHLGYGTCSNVITNVALEDLASAGRITRPSDGRPVGSVLFIQQAVPPGAGRFSYASGVRDMVTLKQALYFRERNPEARVYIVYEDMVTLGTYEYFYRRVSQEPQVLFTKAQVAGVRQEPDGTVAVDLENALVVPRLTVKVDMVVLAAGMVPTTLASPTLNLQYRQGPELPATPHGFADSNYICFPYETRRTALYAAGCVRQPMDIPAALEDAAGATLKAIQALELVSSGRATHPRAGDLSFPRIRTQSCTQCRRCLEECPFSVIEADERGYPRVNEDRCRRCGICMGACPVQVISFDNYSIPQLSSMVSAFPVPEEEGSVRIVAFACENDAYPAFDMAGINRLAYDPSVRVIPVRCIGSVNMVLVRDALNRGVDGVLLIGCKSGDDYQCHFITGSGLAERRMENVRETVQRMMMEPERVQPVQLEISEFDRIPGMLKQFVEQLREMGPNPYKGF